ncbi:putative glutamate decarboxylase [Medicago truncatula]|uniref:Putative glutamate decarboxylase n=1 Tax=Medicago truncatula TaxID=3880 RepID=A0A396I1P7_MEDTR|nr:putative glutamate decarboxylase [Medicago truncatula]
MSLFILELAGLYGVSVMAFSHKHRRIYNEYTISKMLRHYGWIVLAYQMFLGAQHIIVLRAVIRARFSCALVERLVLNIKIVFRELHKFSLKLRPTLRGRGTWLNLQLVYNLY